MYVTSCWFAFVFILIFCQAAIKLDRMYIVCNSVGFKHLFIIYYVFNYFQSKHINRNDRVEQMIIQMNLNCEMFETAA